MVMNSHDNDPVCVRCMPVLYRITLATCYSDMITCVCVCLFVQQACRFGKCVRYLIVPLIAVDPTVVCAFALYVYTCIYMRIHLVV